MQPLLDVLYFASIIVTLTYFTSALCEDPNTKHFVNDPSEMQFVSTRIMQCKYGNNYFVRALPHIFCFVALWTAVLFDQTLLTIQSFLLQTMIDPVVRSPMNLMDILSITSILSITIGVWMIVHFDHVNASGSYGDLNMVPYPTDPHTCHAIGVFLLFAGVFVLNSCILYWLLWHLRGAGLRTIRYEYEVFEVIYLVIVVLFFVFFIIRQTVAAVFLEYTIVGLIVLCVLMSRQVYYYLKHSMN